MYVSMAFTLFTADDRGVSSVIGYITNLAVLVLVVSAISLVGTTQFETVREDNAEKDFQGLTEQVALEVQVIDQINQAGANPTTGIARAVEFPAAVSGFTYSIGFESVSNTGNYEQYEVVVKFQDGVEVRSPVESRTPLVVGSYIDGGAFDVVRPQPSDPDCEKYTGADGAEKCKITLQERNR